MAAARSPALRAPEHEDGDLGVVHYPLGLAPHQDAPHGAQPAASSRGGPRPDLLAQQDDLVGGASPAEMCPRDLASGGPDLLYLPVEHLLAPAPELPLHEVVGEPPYVVPDVDDVQLGAAHTRQIEGRHGRPLGILRTVGGQQNPLRKLAHPRLLSSSYSPDLFSNTTAVCRQILII